MRKAIVKYNNIKAGILSEDENGEYQFVYDQEYVKNYPEKFITFNMPVSSQHYKSKRLFPFFDGLIPEGWLLNNQLPLQFFPITHQSNNINPFGQSWIIKLLH